MLVRFWWGAKASQRKVHWLSWPKMCMPKSMGGMGLRDLGVFHQAMLASKLGGWQLAKVPSSIGCSRPNTSNTTLSWRCTKMGILVARGGASGGKIPPVRGPEMVWGGRIKHQSLV